MAKKPYLSNYVRTKAEAEIERRRAIRDGHSVQIKRVGGSRPGGLDFGFSKAVYRVDVYVGRSHKVSSKTLRVDKRRVKRIKRTPKKQRSELFYLPAINLHRRY